MVVGSNVTYKLFTQTPENIRKEYYPNDDCPQDQELPDFVVQVSKLGIVFIVNFIKKTKLNKI